MSNIKPRMVYPDPDDVTSKLAEALWDIHWGIEVPTAARYVKGYFGTFEWVLRAAETLYEVNSMKLDAAAKRRLESAFKGIPEEELKKRKKRGGPQAG